MDKVAIFDSLNTRQIYEVQSKLFKRLADKTSLKFDSPPILVDGMIGNDAYLPGKGTWEDTPHNIKVMNQHYTNSAKIDKRIDKIIRRNEALLRSSDTPSIKLDDSTNIKLDSSNKIKLDDRLHSMLDDSPHLKVNQYNSPKASKVKDFIAKNKKLIGATAAIGLGGTAAYKITGPKPNILMKNKGKAGLAIAALLGGAALANRNKE